jgi:hypothetical protein
MRSTLIFLMLAALLCTAGPAWSVPADGAPAEVEIATGPDGLLQMEQQGKVTVRALRGWGRLPDTYVRLAQRMRQEAGLDLLGADLGQIRTWSADPSLAQYGAELTELAGFMEGGEHLDWAPPAPGASVPAGTLVRSAGVRWAQEIDGPVAVPDASPGAGSANAAAAPVAQADAPAPVIEPEPSAPEATEAASEQPVAAADEPEQAQAPDQAPPNDVGPEDGVEFPINYQVPGTYRVKLRVEGLRNDSVEPWFKYAAPALLPDNPDILAREKAYFEERTSRLPDPGEAGDPNSPYDLVLGVATPDTPVVIRVDAPENPAVSLSEQEIKDNVSYRVLNKSLLFHTFDAAGGNADIDFKKDLDSVSWTPRIDPGTGRPVGPRAVGVYMAYRLKKYVGEHELGVLKYQYHRIGWVLAAMPGDVYERSGSLYAVGSDEPISGGDASAGSPVQAADKIDFELSQFALDSGAIKLSDDLKHAAWVDGERKGRKRMFVNGRPGPWHDDIKTYSMRFSPNGESFYYEAEVGEKIVPILNGAQGPVFDDIDTRALSDDGASLLVGGESGGLYRVFLNGSQVRETPDRVEKSVIGPDGKAAWAERGKDESGKKYAVVVASDGVVGTRYAGIHSDIVRTSGRSDMWYVAEKEGGDRYLIRDGEELKPSMGYGSQFTVTPDGHNYAYVAPQGQDMACMVVGGQIGPDFKKIWNPAKFSADGSRHIYEGRGDNDASLVVDGKVVSHGFGPLKDVAAQTFSPDGSRWAAGFQLNDEEYVVVVDGKEVGRGSGKPRSIVFSPDGSRVAWLEKNKKFWRAYLDGEAGPEFREIYDDEPPQFSPDGKHFVYFARDKEKKMHAVVFGGEDKANDIVAPRAVFTSSGLEYLAVDGNRLRKHVIALP